jgi:putative transposase
VTPAQRRAAVAHVQRRFGRSPRQACRLVGGVRSTIRYRHRYRDDAALRAQWRELAAQRPRFGYRRLHVLRRREGLIVNHKRVERLYRTRLLSSLSYQTPEDFRRVFAGIVDGQPGATVPVPRCGRMRARSQ